ncbi:PQQ-binding-like beta-propeller repeat protein [bacterium]|nr:PQQ-binding-like beta-propeller repeat protein [bacterium]
MNNSQNNNKSLQKPLRLWPGVVLAIVLLVSKYLVPLLLPEYMVYGLLGSLGAAVAIILWWLFFSRALWSERLGALAVMALALFATYQFLHISIAKGAMGMLFWILSIPILTVAFVAWAVLTRRLSNRVRRVTMVLTIFLGCGFWILIRTGGFSGQGENDFAWRWSPTPEDRLLAQEQTIPPSAVTPAPQQEVQPQTIDQTAETPSTATEPQTQQAQPKPPEQEQTAEATPAAQAVAQKEPEWPGFRGPNRDSIVRGVQINTDWTASPPVEIWRRPIGPGWSSFAVDGDHIYTQEQRGEQEAVSCYNIKTGEPVWRHIDDARFWESNAGAGPRGTPTLHKGRVYAFGGTGILNVLNAADGSAVWTRNAAKDTKAKTPGWGFSSSPLVVDDAVILAVSGQLAAYDLQTGKPRWFGPKGGQEYTSPHLATIEGVQQVLMMNNPGAISVVPATGKLLWKHELPKGTRIVQPAITAEGDLLLTDGDAHGLRRVAVDRESSGWTVKERWSTIGLKPYFNDFVIQDGHAYGFDGNMLSCIDLNDGTKKWKGGKYGAGQLVLLADQKVLLVLAEKGDIALVNAAPDQFKELARVPAIKGKTWNHPVLVDDVLLVRNGEEMAAFRLAKQ